MSHVVITGGTRGIGFALAREFRKTGWSVTISGTGTETVSTALNALAAVSSPGDTSLQGVSGDVRHIDHVRNLWEKAADMAPVDIWINNAGIDQYHAPVWEIAPEEIKTTIDVNIMGMIHGTHVAIQGMKEQGFGKIFNMEGFGSSGSMRPYLTIYGTTKRAVRYFTRSLVLENPPVIIGTLGPGMVITDFVVQSMYHRPQDAETIRTVFNILGELPETVAPFLVRRMIRQKKSGGHIEYLPGWKAMLRFFAAPLRKNRGIFEKAGYSIELESSS